MPGPARFDKVMVRMAGRIEKRTEKTVRRAVIAIEEKLVATTPVDTGLARSNWIVSLDVPREEVREIRDPASVIRSARGTLAAYRLGRALFITNSVPYITFLNYGTSDQAPPGFVEEAMVAGRKVIRGYFGRILSGGFFGE